MGRAVSGRRLVAGVDSSTQSTKVVVHDAETGALVRSGRAGHPDGTEVHPDRWWEAFETASEGGLLEGVSAIAVGGQQHGLVTTDDTGAVVRDALLWNDNRSAEDAASLVEELGAEAWVEAVGSVPVASFTVTKLRWMARHEPQLADRVARVELPHDWLTARLLDGGEAVAESVTDRGDASGTGYWSPAKGEYRTDLVERGFGRVPSLPTVLEPDEPAGRTASGLVVGPGTGDNMGAALGLGIGTGDAVVSLGTSGTAFAVHDTTVRDATGAVAGFADATGGHLPLVCTLNAARVITSAAQMLGVDVAELERLALAASPGAEGITLLPFLDGERTPTLPDASGTLAGLRRTNMTPENVARAAYEGMLCNVAAGVEALRAHGVQIRRVLLIGGASVSGAVQAIAPDVLGAQVVVPVAGEYVGRGAARQAAWVLSGEEQPPEWDVDVESVVDPDGSADPDAVRGRYAEVLRATHGI